MLPLCMDPILSVVQTFRACAIGVLHEGVVSYGNRGVHAIWGHSISLSLQPQAHVHLCYASREDDTAGSTRNWERGVEDLI